MTRRRVLAVSGAVAVMVLLLPVSPASAHREAVTPVAARLAATGDALPVAVELGAVAPAAVKATDDLVVTGRLVNTGPTALTDLRVTLRLQSQKLTTRDDVAGWISNATSTGAGSPLPVSIGVPGLTPGASAPFTLRAPRGSLGLPSAASAFGPRGIAVDVASAGTRVGLHRTTIVWSPAARFDPFPTALSLLAPITAQTPGGGAATTDGSWASAAMTSGGQLSRLLDAVADPVIGWAIDPSLLAAAQTAVATGTSPVGPTPGGSPSSASSSGPPTATTRTPVAVAADDWLTRVRGTVAGRDVWSLPYGDVDLAALARQSSVTTAASADRAARAATVSALGRRVDDGWSWPADGVPAAGTLDLITRTRHSGVVLASATVPPEVQVGYTLTGRATLRTSAGALNAVLYDESLSSAFGRAGTAGTADATQQLLAETAAITLERPYDTRHLLVTAPRGWNPDPAAVRATLATMRAVPWVRLDTVGDLKRTPTPQRKRAAPTVPQTGSTPPLPAGEVRTTTERLTRLHELAPAFAVTADDTTSAGVVAVERLRSRALLLLSNAWRGRSGHGGAVASLAREVLALDDGVRVTQGSTLNLLASEASVPVVVANDLPYPLRVVLTLRPRTGQITVPETVPITLSPDGNRQRIPVPVRAVASGDVELEATLSTPDGDPVGRAAVLDVRVRRGWELRGFLGIAVVLGVLLLFGLFRGARRGRPDIPTHTVPDVDEQATARSVSDLLISDSPPRAGPRRPDSLDSPRGVSRSLAREAP